MSALTGIQKILIAVLAVALLGGAYFFYSSRAATELALTLDSNTNLERGLVGHWTFDGKDVDWSSTTAEIRDRSGNNRHGNASGGMSTTSSPTMGVLGQGVNCDGLSQWMNMGNVSAWELHNTDSTITFWLKSVVVHQDSDVIDRGDGVNAGYQFTFSEPGYRLGSGFFTDGGDRILLGPYVLTPEQWYHVTMVTTLSPKEGKLYIDGDLFQTDAYTGNLINRSEALSICSDESGNSNFNGSLDDVRIYNRALSADEVKRTYQLGATTKISQTLDTNPNLKNGLVLHYTFENKDLLWSSTTAEIRDTSGYNNHGNAQLYLGSTSTAQGVLGQAVAFKGSLNGVIEVASSTSTNDLGPMTYALWLYDIGRASEGVLLDKGISSTSTIYVYANALGKLHFYKDYSGTDLAIRSQNGALPLRGWVHVTFTWDGTATATGAKIFLDGVETTYTLRTNGVGSVVPDTPYNTFIMNGTYRNRTFDGYVDDIRLYNRVLSNDEIKRLYELGATTKVAQTLDSNTTLESGLVGHWTFDGEYMDWSSTTAEIRDKSGNNNKGDAQGGMSTASVTYGPLGQAMTFDGVDDVMNFDSKTAWNLTTTDSTLSLWFKTDADVPPGNSVYLIDHEDTSVAGYAFKIPNSGTTPDALYYIHAASINNGLASTTAWRLGEWNHVVGVTDTVNSVVRLYLNGTLVDTDPYSGALVNRDQALIVGGIESGDEVLDGSLDDVRIYNRALSADEVKRLYELGR